MEAVDVLEAEGSRIARRGPPLDRPAATTTDTADPTAFTVASPSHPMKQMYCDRRPAATSYTPPATSGPALRRPQCCW